MALSVNHPQARRFFSSALEKAKFQGSFLMDSPLVKALTPGEDMPPDCVIAVEEGLKPPGSALTGANKGAGYRIDYALDGPVYGVPFSGDNRVTGASKLSLFSDYIEINQERFPLESDGAFAEGVIPWEFRERVMRKLKNDYFPMFWDERILGKASGALGSGTWLTLDPTKATSSARSIDGSIASDGNDLRAPSTGRIVYGNKRASQAAITTADYASLNILDDAVMKAVLPGNNATLKRAVPHLLLRNKPSFVWVIGTEQAADLTRRTSDRFYDLMKAAGTGGKGIGKELIDWSTYYYSTLGYDVYIVVHPKMVRFSAAATGGEKVMRSLLLGRGAMRVALGRKTKSIGAFDWYERELDEGNITRITAGLTEGVQKPAYTTTESGSTREDYAVMAIDTYCDY